MENEATHRLGQPSDLQTIVDFQLAMAKETENLDLDRPAVEKGVGHIMAHPEVGRYLMVEHKGKIVASMLNLYEWSDWRNGNMLWIHSLYVSPEWRGKGLFRAMYNRLQTEVEGADDLLGIRLYVDRTNLKAQEVYAAIGMNKEHYEMYEWMC